MQVDEAYSLLQPDRPTTTLFIIAAAAFLFHLAFGSWVATHSVPPRIGDVLVACYLAAPLTAWLLVAVGVVSYVGYLHERRDAARRR
ncbi:MAG TPA: hypothetical protein VF292_02855 [Rhodanobacteraceae bacterium]